MATFTKPDGSKRTLFNFGPLGGISSSVVTLFFFCLPFVEFAAIFNPVVFNKLGIAQSIVFFIVFLSIVMIIVFLVTWKINKSVLKKIDASWERFFPNVDLKMVLSSGVTPYSDFYKFYALSCTLEEDELHKALLKDFEKMQEENKELLEAIQKDRSRA